MSLPIGFLAEFVASMPPIYHESHDREAVEAHARVSAERGSRTANVGVYPAEDGVQSICMVAEDRPGVLACMSAALVSERLDVVDAEVYTRRTAAANSSLANCSAPAARAASIAPCAWSISFLGGSAQAVASSRQKTSDVTVVGRKPSEYRT